MSNSSDNKKQKPILRVLALDGGGVRGLIPLRFLQAIEEATGQPTHKIFHTIAGTSTGGLITALLTLPKEPPKAEGAQNMKNSEVLKDVKNTKDVKSTKDNKNVQDQPPATAGEALALYKERGEEIFPQNIYQLKKNLIGTLLYFLIGMYIISKLRAWKEDLPENERTYVHLFQTSALAAVLAVLLIICIFTTLAGVYFVIKFFFFPAYSGTSVHRFCKRHFLKNIGLKDAKANVGIVATDVQKHRSFVFNSMRAKIDHGCKLHNAYIGKIARATSAAPTFFKRSAIDIVAPKPGLEPQKWKILKEHLVDEMTPWDSRDQETFYDRPKIEFEDGGTIMNNPSKAALKLAQLQLKQERENPENYEIRLLSVGTGSLTGKQDDPTVEYRDGLRQGAKRGPMSKFLDKYLTPDWAGGKLGVVFRRLTGDVFEVSTNAHNDHLKVKQYYKEIGKPGCYWRQQFQISEHQLTAMDDSSKGNMEDLVKCAEMMLFEGGSDGQQQKKREWSKEFKECVEFLNLKIIYHPEDIAKANAKTAKLKKE